MQEDAGGVDHRSSGAAWRRCLGQDGGPRRPGPRRSPARATSTRMRVGKTACFKRSGQLIDRRGASHRRSDVAGPRWLGPFHRGPARGSGEGRAVGLVDNPEGRIESDVHEVCAGLGSGCRHRTDRCGRRPQPRVLPPRANVAGFVGEPRRSETSHVMSAPALAGSRAPVFPLSLAVTAVGVLWAWSPCCSYSLCTGC